jgi:hypothetical protein
MSSVFFFNLTLLAYFLSLFQYQAGDAMNMLWMGGHMNCMTVVLFIHRQDILPGSL